MGSISIILRRPPYGTVDASEAIRHSLCGLTEGMSVKLILVDGGVNTAKKGQNTASTEYLNMEAGIIDCIDMGADHGLRPSGRNANRGILPNGYRQESDVHEG